MASENKRIGLKEVLRETIPAWVALGTFLVTKNLLLTGVAGVISEVILHRRGISELVWMMNDGNDNHPSTR